MRAIDDAELDRVATDIEILNRDVKHVIEQVREKRLLQRYYQQNPYVVVAAAAGVGYLAGGGLFTPFTRRLVRFGMKAMFVPIAAKQIQNTTD